MNDWTKIADDQSLQKTVESLKKNGIDALVVESGEQAKAKVLGMLPKDAEVMTMTSVTLEAIGLVDEVNNSGNYPNNTRAKFAKMDKQTQGGEMKKLGAAPDWTIGSAHAVTEEGSVLIASNTGSQLTAYVYGASHLIWVVGAQKVVKNTDEGIKRVYEHVLPLESERANKAYSITTGSNVSKLLIVNKEVSPNRITLILVKEKLGF